MWKLTITQKRKSEYSDYMTESKIVFVNENLRELTFLLERMAESEPDVETSYEIEWEEKEGEE